MTLNKKNIALIIILILILAMILLLLLPKKKLYYKMTIDEIDQDIREISGKGLTNQEKMVYYSERFLKAPYDLSCEGDGEYAKYDKQPLLNFKKLNCMTYCEIVLALTLSDYYEDMFNILQHIRYRNGIIGMATRNHYTMADWLPANSWCLDDVSRDVGEKDTAKLTRTISHKRFFADKGINDIPLYLPDRELTIDYIPLNKLSEHEDKLKSGDIVALIQDVPGIFSAHMLIIIKNSERTFFRHASMKAGKVLDSPFNEYIAELSEDSKYLGMSLMRVKDKIQWRDGVYTHGKFFIQ